MLTRLEVDGFKNLIGVAVDFGPLTCIAGPNSVGKATHSPAFVQLQRPADLLFAQEVKIRDKDGKAVRTLRFRPLAGTWRARPDATTAIGLSTIVDYLTAPENAQLKLPAFDLDALAERPG